MKYRNTCRKKFLEGSFFGVWEGGRVWRLCLLASFLMDSAGSLNIDAKIVLVVFVFFFFFFFFFFFSINWKIKLGDSAVGKTSIALRYVQDIFSSSSNPTIGASFLTKRVYENTKRKKKKADNLFSLPPGF